MQLASWKKIALYASLALTVGSAHAYDSVDKKTLKEVGIELHGRNPLKPSKKSLIGKYLSETGAKTVTRKFLTAPPKSVNPPSKLGAEKLVVAIGEESFEKFKAKLSGKNYLYVYFTPNAGTLYISFEGQYGNPVYSRRMSPLHFNSPGTLMVPILLDSAEADRVGAFIKASLNPNTHRYMESPWALQTKNKTRYSASSAFQGCTHWFGNIPIGNKQVGSYFFPAGDEDADGTKPQTKELEAYEAPTGMNREDEELLRQIWTVPGRQQLGEVLAPGANRRGEFTNPGWVMYTLLGAVGTDRVPVVFLFTRDEKEAIPANFPTYISHQ